MTTLLIIYFGGFLIALIVTRFAAQSFYEHHPYASLHYNINKVRGVMFLCAVFWFLFIPMVIGLALFDFFIPKPR